MRAVDRSESFRTDARRDDGTPEGQGFHDLDTHSAAGEKRRNHDRVIAGESLRVVHAAEIFRSAFAYCLLDRRAPSAPGHMKRRSFPLQPRPGLLEKPKQAFRVRRVVERADETEVVGP